MRTDLFDDNTPPAYNGSLISDEDEDGQEIGVRSHSSSQDDDTGIKGFMGKFVLGGVIVIGVGLTAVASIALSYHTAKGRNRWVIIFSTISIGTSIWTLFVRHSADTDDDDASERSANQLNVIVYPDHLGPESYLESISLPSLTNGSRNNKSALSDDWFDG